MATSIRVKGKSAWKSLQIHEDLFNIPEFSNLVEIQELTDYELLPSEVYLGNAVTGRSRLSNKRKRKRENLEETASTHLLDDTPQLNKKKIRKTGTDSENTNCEIKPAVQDTRDVKNEDENLEQFTAQKKKKKNNATKFPLSRKANCEDDMFIDNTDDITALGDTTELSEDHRLEKMNVPANSSNPDKTKKRKRRKKKVQNSGKIEVNSKVEDDNVVKTETSNKVEDMATKDSQKSLKKKRNKNTPQESQATETNKEVSLDCRAEPDSCSDAEEEESTPPEKNIAEIDMSQWKNLYVPDVLLQALQDQGFDTPTPIQNMALPSAIRDRRDILAAAETGSGKTLAFGIPLFARILNSARFEVTKTEDQDEEMESNGSDLETNSGELEGNVGPHPPLALILEPTRELAVQVRKHLTALAKYTDIKFATVVGGMSIEKQRRILGKKPHVVIATPGRLWQLIEEGDEHLMQLDAVLCLVVDEADRMIEKGHYEELTKLLEMMNKSPRRLKNRQTFIMSATLTMDIGAPKRVTSRMKKKAISDDKLKTLTDRICVGHKPKIIDLTPKDKVAQTLTELRVNCKATEKDFYLYYFLCRHPGRTLVFANSKDCLRRLVSLLSLLQCSPLPLHADMQQRQRLKNLDKFAANNRGLLVASDVAARGLDIPNVDHVIHYQVPRTMENYVHRSGRTARASNLGLSVMLVGPEDARDYRKIVYGVRNGEELPLLPVEMDLMPAVKQRVMLARDVDVKEYRIKKKRLKNNFFTKAAEEMDMVLDDTNLLEDMGDMVEQAQDSKHLKQMKTQLAFMLRTSLQPSNMTRYPTKSGQLISSKKVNLHQLR